MNKKFLVFIAAGALGLALATNAQAALVGTAAPTQVLSIASYSDYGGGDVIVTVATSVAGCEGGFWLRPSDPGFESSLAMLMSAKLAGRAVTILGYDNQIWPGSASKFCRLYYINVE
jgi:hypothetical protein